MPPYTPISLPLSLFQPGCFPCCSPDPANTDNSEKAPPNPKHPGLGVWHAAPCCQPPARCRTPGEAPPNPLWGCSAMRKQLDPGCGHCPSRVPPHHYRFSCLVYASLRADLFPQKPLGSSLVALKSGWWPPSSEKLSLWC